MFHIFYLPFATLHVNPVRKSPPSRTVVRRGVNVKSLWTNHSDPFGRTERKKDEVCEMICVRIGFPSCSRLSTSVLTSNCEKSLPKLSVHVAEAKDEPWQTCLSARQHFKFLKLDVSKLRQREIPNKDTVCYGVTWLNFALKRHRTHWW